MTSIPLVLRRASALSLLFAAFTTHAAGLPDTGQTLCYNDTAVADTEAASNANSIARDVGGTHPRQDCRYGRDPAVGATKIGGGTKGLDYRKISNDGAVVSAAAPLGTGSADWACTQDNITGLIWEVKTTSGLRNKDHTYTWYNNNGTTNGGDAGTASGGTCQTAGRCDTELFVDDVNSATLCGYTDWRMPTVRELLTLVLLDGTIPSSIDPTYFPQTNPSDYWSASSYVEPPIGYAWVVSFQGNGFASGGVSAKNTKLNNPKSVRLVRGGPF